MTNVWRTPVFDRTWYDVEFAIQQIAEWKHSHTHAADIRLDNNVMIANDAGDAQVIDDKLEVQWDGKAYIENGVLVLRNGDVYELKGCLNLSDLNRIEGNIGYLAERLEGYSYSPDVSCKQWTIVDLPTEDDMSRIVENIRALMDAFYYPNNPPSLPKTMLSYTDINAIEENLYLIKQMLDGMQSSFKHVGTTKSGARMIL